MESKEKASEWKGGQEWKERQERKKIWKQQIFF